MFTERQYNMVAKSGLPCAILSWVTLGEHSVPQFPPPQNACTVLPLNGACEDYLMCVNCLKPFVAHIKHSAITYYCYPFYNVTTNCAHDIQRLDVLSCFLEVNELKECLSVLVREQQALAIQSATTTLSALRLKQRLVVLERYFIALNRTVFQENVKVKWKSSSVSLPPVDKKR